MGNQNDKKRSDDAERGVIDPSAPTAGTEVGPDRGKSSNNSRQASSPNARGAGDVRKTSYPASEADDPAAGGESRKEALERNPNNRSNKSFRCADVGVENCNWSVTGNNEEEILGRVQEHAGKEHGIQGQDFEQKKGRIREAIRDRAA